MRTEEALRIPYYYVVSSVQTASGVWGRRVEYPEVPQCVAVAATLMDALDEAERLLVRWIIECIERGDEPPVPRPLLAASYLTLSSVEAPVSHQE